MNKSDKRIRIVFSCGGTGGHIYPAIAIINKIKDSSDLQTVEHLYTEIIYFAEYLPDDIWEEIDLCFQQATPQHFTILYCIFLVTL